MFQSEWLADATDRHFGVRMAQLRTGTPLVARPTCDMGSAQPSCPSATRARLLPLISGTSEILDAEVSRNVSNPTK
ncbi:hypothetical protein NSK11_contig00281-0004 [Nocardia seriolae]|uniref:Uncharacterized protein n=1 Tax=Nocardia seriolae TaxID=37332 RepID=A0ABC9Z743_9NOCA|nr:hypothetical protein NS07_v2contig00277-0004 [Nocardia seriolae]GAP33478.1 hypothetical protein NSK11_contig00281-0004 [Nocardia seriolae]